MEDILRVSIKPVSGDAPPLGRQRIIKPLCDNPGRSGFVTVSGQYDRQEKTLFSTSCDLGKKDYKINGSCNWHKASVELTAMKKRLFIDLSLPNSTFINPSFFYFSFPFSNPGNKIFTIHKLCLPLCGITKCNRRKLCYILYGWKPCIRSVQYRSPGPEEVGCLDANCQPAQPNCRQTGVQDKWHVGLVKLFKKTEEAVGQGLSGRMMAEVAIEADGVINKVEVIGTSRLLLAEAACDCICRMRFFPSMWKKTLVSFIGSILFIFNR